MSNITFKESSTLCWKGGATAFEFKILHLQKQVKRSMSSRLRSKQVHFEIISTSSFHLRSAQDNLNTIFDPLIVLPLLKCLLGNFFQFAGVPLIWFINKKLWSFETSCLTLSSISNHTCCEPTCYFFRGHIDLIT